MSKKVVYVACPYTLGDVAVNVHNAFRVVDELANKGFIPYVPVWTHFWHLVNPHPYEFWLELDLELLRRCDCVLRIDGQSNGADREVEYAKSIGIPVYYRLSEIPLAMEL